MLHAQKLLVNAYGVDLSSFQPGDKKDNVFRVVFAGGLSPRKGAHYLLQAFRETALAAIGKRYLPNYRMADGEYRFLMGRRYNFHRRPLWRELLAVTAEKVRIKDPDRWATSWGETYPPEMTRHLRIKLLQRVREIAEAGLPAEGK